LVATFWDHGLIIVIIVLVFPLVGLWSYRRFLKRAAIEGEPALIREYQQTIFLWLAGLALATIVVGQVNQGPSALCSPQGKLSFNPDLLMEWQGALLSASWCDRSSHW
jgi:hypothetical protein